MKILLDMNMSPLWVDLFTAAGSEAAHWSALGDQQAPDHEIMAFAASNRYTVLTQDLDFGSLLFANGAATPSVVQLRLGRITPANNGALVLTALRQLAWELESGALVTIDAKKLRLNILPLVVPEP